MKRLFQLALSVCGIAGFLCASAPPARADTILVDFGNDLSYRGTNVVNPDPNGHFWNSVHSGAFHANLLDLDGNATAVDLGFDFAAGTDYYNGPSGATADPSASVYDAAALGNLGVDEAVYDYYVSSRFQLQQLDPTLTYNLTFYGAHQYNTDNQTVYTVYTDASYSTPVDSVNLTVGVGAAHNSNTVVTISGLSPQSGNVLYIGFAGANGNEGYLNAMQIEVVPEPAGLALVGLGGLLLALWKRRARA